MKAISLKLDERQLKLLDQVSKASRIPKSSLIRKGIELVLIQAKEEMLSVEFRKEVDALLKQDHVLLQRLARA